MIDGNREMGPVLVVGASGFIGTRLVARLQKARIAVRALDVSPPRQKLAGVEYIFHDVRTPIPTALGDGVSRIYNFAAIHRTPGHPDNEYYDTNILGARNVIALAKYSAISTIVFTSSISVYGPSEEILTEKSTLHPTSSYGRSKRIAEQLHQDWAADELSRRLVIVRPGVVFGPGERGNYSNLAMALRRGIFIYPGRKDTIKSGGYVDELLNTFEFALSRGESPILYNFAYPQMQSTQEIIAEFGRVSGVRTSYPTVPLTPLLATALVFEMGNNIGLKNPIHRERVLKLVKSTRVEPSWLIENGYEFKTSLREAIKLWSDETNGAFS